MILTKIGLDDKRILSEESFSELTFIDRGRGRSCECFDAKDSNGAPVRLKKCFAAGRQEAFLAACRLQVRLMNSKMVNGLVSFRGLYRDEDGFFWSCVNYRDGTTLSKVECGSLHEYLSLIKAVAEVVSAIHQEGFLILDLNPDNVFAIKSGTGLTGVQLFDFDNLVSIEELDAAQKEGRAISLPSTRGWQAPEQMGSGSKIGTATDIYLLAVMLFYALFHRTPEAKDRYGRIDFSKATFQDELTFSVREALKDLFMQALSVFPEKRPSIEELQKSLSDLYGRTDPSNSRFVSNCHPGDFLTDHFVEQDALFSETYSFFQDSTATRPVAVFYSGFPGMGKTTNAAAFALKYQHEYDAICFVRPDQKIEDALLMNDSEADSKDKLNALAKGEQKFLLILDDFKDTEELPTAPNADIIITTKSNFKWPNSRVFEILDSSEKALAIFRGAFGTELSEESVAMAGVMLSQFGDHAYVADLLGHALYQKCGATDNQEVFSRYLESIKTNKSVLESGLINNPKDRKYGAPGEGTPAELLDWFIDDLFNSSEDPREEEVLYLLSRAVKTHSNPISLGGTTTLIGDNEELHQFEALHAVQRMAKRSLLQIRKDEIVIHSMVQEYLEKRYPKKGIPSRDLHYLKNFLAANERDIFQWMASSEFPVRWIHVMKRTIYKRNGFPLWLEYLNLVMRKQGYEQYHEYRADFLFQQKVTAWANRSESDVEHLICRGKKNGESLYFGYWGGIMLYPFSIVPSYLTFSADGNCNENLRTETGDKIQKMIRYGKLIPFLREKAYQAMKGWDIEILHGGGFDTFQMEDIFGGKIKVIGMSAFGGRKELRRVTLPDTVQIIRQHAFAKCDTLQLLDMGNGLREISGLAFMECKSLTDITWSPQLHHIGMGAFMSCHRLNSLSIPDCVTEIEEDAFSCCDGLENISIGNNVVDINGVFFRCSNLSNIYIPPSVKHIAQTAFWDSPIKNFFVDDKNSFFSSEDGVLFSKDKKTLLMYPPGKNGSEYQVPEGVTEIDRFAFPVLENYYRLRRLFIPSSVKIIPDIPYLFSCVTEIVVSDENTQYASEDGVLFSKDKKTLLWCSQGKVGEYSIPFGVSRIEAYAFCGCSYLTGISVPSGVTSIGRMAFNDCSRLKTVTLPASVSEIGLYCFSNTSAKLCVPAGSYAEIYARENGIPFELIP